MNFGLGSPSNAMEMRSKYKEAFQKKHNLKLGFMSAFVKAAAFALQDQPVVNAVIDDLEIVYRDYIDISVAVATPKVSSQVESTYPLLSIIALLSLRTCSIQIQSVNCR